MSNINTLLQGTRPSAGTEVAYNLITDRGIPHYAKRVYTANDLSASYGITFLGVAFNDSTTSYPNYVRGLVQVNDSVYVSGKMPKYKDSLVNLIGLVYNRYYASPKISTIYGDTYVGKQFYYEIQTDNSGNKPFYCWVVANRVPTTDDVRIQSVCNAPGGVANAADFVAFKYGNDSFVANLTSSLSTREGVADFLIDKDETPSIYFGLNSRSSIAESVSLTSLSSVETTGTQTYGGGYTISRQVRSPSGNYLVVSGVTSASYAIDGTTGASMFSNSQTYGTANGNEYQSTNLINSRFASATTKMPVFVMTYLKDGDGNDVQTGVVSAFDKPASDSGATLALNCPDTLNNVI